MSLYSSYINNFDNSLHLVDRFLQRKEFKEFVEVSPLLLCVFDCATRALT